MASITVRDIPDDTYERLKELAEREHRSLNAEVIVAMERLITQDELYQQRARALQRIIARRKQIAPTDADSVELLREDRTR
jgi:plasmid stability protein